jgi:hypothetical protein
MKADNFHRALADSSFIDSDPFLSTMSSNALTLFILRKSKTIR